MVRRFIARFGEEVEPEPDPAPDSAPDPGWFGDWIRDRLIEVGLDPRQDLPFYFHGPQELVDELVGRPSGQCQFWRETAVEPYTGSSSAFCYIVCPGYVGGECCFLDRSTRDGPRHWEIAPGNERHPGPVQRGIVKYFHFHPNCDEIIEAWNLILRGRGRIR